MFGATTQFPASKLNGSFVSATGNLGIISAIEEMDYAIGYTAPYFVNSYGSIKTVVFKSSDDGQIISATDASIESAINRAQFNQDLTALIVDMEDSWPISGIEYFIVHSNTRGNCFLKRRVVDFLLWIVFDATVHQNAIDNGYVPATLTMQKLVQNNIMRIKCNDYPLIRKLHSPRHSPSFFFPLPSFPPSHLSDLLQSASKLRLFNFHFSVLRNDCYHHRDHDFCMRLLSAARDKKSKVLSFIVHFHFEHPIPLSSSFSPHPVPCSCS